MTLNVKHMLPSPDPLNKLKIALAVSVSSAVTISMFSGAIARYVTAQTDYVKLRDAAQWQIFYAAETASNHHDYSVCIQTTERVERFSTAFQPAQALRTHCQEAEADQWIEQAQDFAAMGHYRDALMIIDQVSTTAPLKLNDVEPLIQHWSEAMLDIAQAYYETPPYSLNDAIAVADEIPPSSRVYAQAQQMIQDWRYEWSANASRLKMAQSAIAQGEWQSARHELDRVTQHPFWQSQRQELQRELDDREQEQEYTTLWQTAQDHLARKEPLNAMTLAEQLPNSQPWAERKQQLIAQSDAMQRRIDVCQRLSFGMLDCYS